MRIVDLQHPQREYALHGECGLCLGNFDGVHLGHRALINELKRLNQTHHLPLGAVCFTEHPSRVLTGHALPQINTQEEKLHLLAEAGLSFALLCDFKAVKDLSPEEFILEILLQKMSCRLLVCGFNYTFGRQGKGTPADLARCFASSAGRCLSVVPEVKDGVKTVSSSLIRQLLEAGHPEDAARLLARPFFLTGKVTDGAQNGRKMGFPTANITFPEGSLIPARGAYASMVRIGNRDYPAITNIGTRPTLHDGDDVNCETFLFDFNGDLYGKELRVSLLHFLRPEKQFPDAKALQLQIEKDIKEAKKYF